MDFSLTEEQELLRDTARSLLGAECPASLVRAHIEDPSVADGLWVHLREFTGLVTGQLVDLCLFLEETGAALAPGPFFATTALFAPIVKAIGDDDLLTRVAAGETTGTVAFGTPTSQPAVEAARVDIVAVIDHKGSDGTVHLVDEPTVRDTEPFDFSRPLGEVSLLPSDTSPQHAISRGTFQAAALRQTVALAADQIGVARWMLDTTLAFVKERVQFDRPIGSFQALQHRLADMKLLFERAWSFVYFAAMAIDADHPDAERAGRVAAVSSDDAARHIAKEAVQMHGGIGFTWEHDLHLYVRRAFASERLLAPSDLHRNRLEELVL